MRPCFTSRKLIAASALELLDSAAAEKLRIHLRACAGCRAHWEQLAETQRVLSGAEPRADIETSPHFHRRIIFRLKNEDTPSAFWKPTQAWLGWIFPALATSVFLALVFVSYRHIRMAIPVETSVAAVPKKETARDLDPSVANYQRVANGSLDTLDALLAKQGSRGALPGPIYTAAAIRTDFD